MGHLKCSSQFPKNYLKPTFASSSSRSSEKYFVFVNRPEPAGRISSVNINIQQRLHRLLRWLRQKETKKLTKVRSFVQTKWFGSSSATRKGGLFVKANENVFPKASGQKKHQIFSVIDIPFKYRPPCLPGLGKQWGNFSCLKLDRNESELFRFVCPIDLFVSKLAFLVELKKIINWSKFYWRIS